MKINRAALAVLIERSGFTKSKFASAAAISPGTLSDLLTGRRRPSPDVATRMAQALKVPLPAILCDPEEAKA